MNIFVACTAKGESIEEEHYNPFDTSEQLEESDSAETVIYSLDSLDKTIRENKLN